MLEGIRGQIDFNWFDRDLTLSVPILNDRICKDIREKILNNVFILREMYMKILVYTKCSLKRIILI